MNLNCAILHADPEIAGRLEEYIDKVPFLSLHGKYGNPLEALKDYYETKVEVYFIGIYPVEDGRAQFLHVFPVCQQSGTLVLFAGCRYVRLQTQARSGRGSEGDLHAV